MNKKTFDKIKIFCFSGTGNSRNVANWIKTKAESENTPTEIIDVGKLEKRKVENIPKNTLMGFCSPTHGFNFPPIMMHFIFRFPRGKKNPVFIINTRAGMKIGKLFVPGLSGIALWLAAIVLLLKGYKIIGLRSIDLPSNWISLHPGVKQSVVKSLFSRREKDTINFITKLLEGKKVYKALWDMAQDIIISPISVLYYLFGRFVFAKSFIASKDCTNCDLCINKCPIGAIKIVDNRCFWTYKCESCMQCMNKCPERAIETAHGFIIGLGFLVNSIFLVWLYNLLNLDKLIQLYIPGMLTGLFTTIFNTVIFFGILLFSYFIMHYLLRFRFIERFIVYTSFTKYKFWRRYKPLKKRD